MLPRETSRWQMRTFSVFLMSKRLTVTSRREGGSCIAKNPTTKAPFRPMSKRRRGYPSEAKVKRGIRFVHGDKLLEEKLGRNDLCPCRSGKRFKKCCLKSGRF